MPFRKLLTTSIALFLFSCCSQYSSVPMRIENNKDPSSLYGSTTFGLKKLSISENGENWTTLVENVDNIVVSPGQKFELPDVEIRNGDYSGVKFELQSGMTLVLEDQTTVNREFPSLSYFVGGISSCSGPENGFPETNEYFLFSTLNKALQSPISVEGNGRSMIVISFKSSYGVYCKPEPDIDFMAWITYTQFIAE